MGLYTRGINLNLSYYTDLEWIDNNKDISIKELNNLDYFNLANCSEITLFRDYNYDLKLRITGELKTGINELREDIMNTHFGITINGYSDYRITAYEINNCYIASCNTNYNFKENGSSKEFVELTYLVNGEVNIIHNNFVETDQKLLIEWYLNGININFPRTTDRKYYKSLARSRYGLDSEDYLIKKFPAESGSRDCSYFNCGNLKFLVFKTLKDAGPDWSINYGIEYRNEWGIPDKETRNSIAEIISFLFGTQLLNIGYNTYSTDHYIIESHLLNPPGDNIQTLCRTSKSSPIGIDYYASLGFEIETTLIEPINNYLLLGNTLRLDEVLWRYWIGKRMPIGTNLPILASGLEVLANSWIKSNLSSGSNVYFEQEEFLSLIADELETLSAKLESYDFKGKILNKFKSAYHTGVNEKLEIMFSDLGIELSRKDKRALQARNKMAHGASLEDDKKVREAIDLSYVYLTLYEKIFLKIISFKGLHRVNGSSEHEMTEV